MKASPKRRTFEKFLYKVEGLKLDGWVSRKTYTPSSLWRSLKLDQMSAAKREGSSELKTFERFLRRYDDKVYSGRSGYEERFPIDGTEQMSYLKVWAKAGREESYVKRMLDIDHGESHYSHAYHGMMKSWKSEKEIKSHPNYKYLVQFRELRDSW